jgi:hypothetical protein
VFGFLGSPKSLSDAVYFDDEVLGFGTFWLSRMVEHQVNFDFLFYIFFLTKHLFFISKLCNKKKVLQPATRNI